MTVANWTRGAWTAWGFFKRDLRTDFSYKLSFAFQIVNILLAVASFYFLARLLGEKTLEGYSSFAFIAVGMMVNAYMTTCLVCFAQGIRGSQVTGTLKALLVTPTAPAALLLYSSAYPLARATLDGVLYLLGGMVFGLSIAHANYPAALLIFLVSLLAFSGIGIFAATCAVVFKRGDPVLWLFGSLSWLLGGVFYPVEVLPPLLRDAAQFLPITHALHGMRTALLGAASIRELLPQLATLALFGLVCLPVSLIAFSLGLRRARVTGTLGHC